MDTRTTHSTPAMKGNSPKLGWITNPIQSTRLRGKCDWMPAVLRWNHRSLAAAALLLR
uniref:Uncharacterized protein n=1 Tax=Arundo donax TaxID=35708 RepID=A0A0A9CQ22_ARUDO